MGTNGTKRKVYPGRRKTYRRECVSMTPILLSGSVVDRPRIFYQSKVRIDRTGKVDFSQLSDISLVTIHLNGFSFGNYKIIGNLFLWVSRGFRVLLVK